MGNRSTRVVVGKTFATLVNPINQTSYFVQFEVVEGNCSPLLSRHAAEQMQLITVNYNCFKLLHQVTTTNILDEYADVFGGGLGTLPGKVHPNMEDGANPVQCPARRVPVTLKPKLKAELDRMVERGVICPIEKPTEWCNQISIQTKKDASMRVCIDPRPLNKVLLRELYPLPTVEEVLPERSTAKVLLKVD